MPISDKFKDVLRVPAKRLRDKLLGPPGPKRRPHETDYLPTEARDKHDPKKPNHELYNFVSIVGDDIGPDGDTQGAYAVANGKSGDVTRFPLPNDPSNPKSKFVENGMPGVIRTYGKDTFVVEMPNGLWHFKRENVHQMKPVEERASPMKEQFKPGPANTPIRERGPKHELVEDLYDPDLSNPQDKKSGVLTVRRAATHAKNLIDSRNTEGQNAKHAEAGRDGNANRLRVRRQGSTNLTSGARGSAQLGHDGRGSRNATEQVRRGATEWRNSDVQGADVFERRGSYSVRRGPGGSLRLRKIGGGSTATTAGSDCVLDRFGRQDHSCRTRIASRRDFKSVRVSDFLRFLSRLGYKEKGRRGDHIHYTDGKHRTQVDIGTDPMNSFLFVNDFPRQLGLTPAQIAYGIEHGEIPKDQAPPAKTSEAITTISGEEFIMSPLPGFEHVRQTKSGDVVAPGPNGNILVTDTFFALPPEARARALQRARGQKNGALRVRRVNGRDVRAAYSAHRSGEHLRQPWHDEDGCADGDCPPTPQVHNASEDDKKPEHSHPHTSVPEPGQTPSALNDQAVTKGQSAGSLYQNIARDYGTLEPGRKSNLRFYDYRPHEPAVDNLIREHGYQTYFAGGKYGKPDLANRNYANGHLMVYDPTPESGGDFGDEAYTRSWRKIHELAHGNTLPDINAKYGEGRRIGKLGVQRTLREAKRAVEWEHLVSMRQRELSKKLGHEISDEDWAREYNVTLHDAVHRAITGQFTNPDDEGFEPSSKPTPLSVSLNKLENAARAMGLKGEDDLLPKKSIPKKEGHIRIRRAQVQPSLPPSPSTPAAPARFDELQVGATFTLVDADSNIVLTKDDEHSASSKDGYLYGFTSGEPVVLAQVRTASAATILRVSRRQRAVVTAASADDTAPAQREVFAPADDKADPTSFGEAPKFKPGTHWNLKTDPKNPRYVIDMLTGIRYLKERVRPIPLPETPDLSSETARKEWEAKLLPMLPDEYQRRWKELKRSQAAKSRAKDRGKVDENDAGTADGEDGEAEFKLPDGMYTAERQTPRAPKRELGKDIKVKPDGGLENIVNVLRAATPKEVDYWKHWYIYAREDVQALSKKYGVPEKVVAALVAVLSPNVKWESNIHAAEQMLRGQGQKVIDYRHRLSQEATDNFAARVFPDLYVEKRTLGTFAYLNNIEKAQRILDVWNNHGLFDGRPDEETQLDWSKSSPEERAKSGLQTKTLYMESETPQHMLMNLWKRGYVIFTTKVGKPSETKAGDKADAAASKKTWSKDEPLTPESLEKHGLPKNGRVIISPPIAGPKVTAFYQSIMDPEKAQNKVVLDGHAQNIWYGVAQGLSEMDVSTPPEDKRTKMVTAYEDASKLSKDITGTHLSPQQVQAITWSVWRGALEGVKRVKKDRSKPKSKSTSKAKSKSKAKKAALSRVLRVRRAQVSMGDVCQNGKRGSYGETCTVHRLPQRSAVCQAIVVSAAIVDVPLRVRRTANKKTLPRLLKQNPQDADVINALAKGDPTQNHDWLEQLYRWSKQGLSVKQLTEFANDIDLFGQALKSRGLSDNPFDYRDYKPLLQSIDEIKAQKVQPKLRKRDAKYDVIYDKDGLKIYDVHNKAASCVLGSDSDWCASKWHQTNYESRRSIADKHYIALFDNGDGYMLRVDDDGEIKTIYQRHGDANALFTKSPEVNSVIEALKAVHPDIYRASVDEHGQRENGDSDDENEDENGEVEIYVLEWADSIVYAATMERDIRQYANDDVVIRGHGYEIKRATVASYDWEENENTPADLSLFNVRTIASVDPEVEERFIIAPFDSDDIEDALNDHYEIFDSELGAEKWLEKNADEVAESGYKVWKAEFTIDQLENESPKYWQTYSGEGEVTAEQEPHPEHAERMDQTVEIYFSTPANDRYGKELKFEDRNTEITNLAEHPDAVRRHYEGGAETVYKGIVTRRELARAERTGSEGKKWLKNKIKNVEKVRDVPEDLVTRYVVFKNGKPFSSTAEGGTVQEAEESFANTSQQSPHNKWELKELQVPKTQQLYASNWPEWTINASQQPTTKLLQTSEADTSKIPERYDIDLTELENFPVGTVVIFYDTRTRTNPVQTIERIADSADGVQYWKDSAGDIRKADAYFPFRGAHRWGSVKLPGQQGKEKPEQETERASGKFTEQQLRSMDIGTKLRLVSHSEIPIIYEKVYDNSWLGGGAAKSDADMERFDWVLLNSPDAQDWSGMREEHRSHAEFESAPIGSKFIPSWADDGRFYVKTHQDKWTKNDGSISSSHDMGGRGQLILPQPGAHTNSEPVVSSAETSTTHSQEVPNAGEEPEQRQLIPTVQQQNTQAPAVPASPTGTPQSNRSFSTLPGMNRLTSASLRIRRGGVTSIRVRRAKKDYGKAETGPNFFNSSKAEKANTFDGPTYKDNKGKKRRKTPGAVNMGPSRQVDGIGVAPMVSAVVGTANVGGGSGGATACLRVSRNGVRHVVRTAGSIDVMDSEGNTRSTYLEGVRRGDRVRFKDDTKVGAKGGNATVAREELGEVESINLSGPSLTVSVPAKRGKVRSTFAVDVRPEDVVLMLSSDDPRA